MNVIARLEYELAYYDSAVHRFNHNTTRTPPFHLLELLSKQASHTYLLTYIHIRKLNDVWGYSYGYSLKKWTRWSEFKFLSRLFSFHIVLIFLEYVWIQVFSFPRWVNIKATWILQPWSGNLLRRRKTLKFLLKLILGHIRLVQGGSR